MPQQPGRTMIESEYGHNVCYAPEEFDLITAADFTEDVQEVMSRPDATHVIVCLGRTTFMDVSGLNALIKSRQAAFENEREFTVRNAGRLPMRVFEVTDTLAYLNVEISD